MARRGEDALARLREELGGVFSVDQGLLNEVRTDRAGWVSAGLPLGVVLATTIDHVQCAVRIAAEFGVPIVPRGAGTGLAGGAVGTPGSLVISTAGMNRILEISPEDEFAVVEPGVINQHLSDAVAEFGLVFAPDPASKEISSIGGNIATNAGGLLCAKYGVTREAVLGLKVVLADGSLLATGRRSVKGVTGLDLTALLTGSEGTLGIIVEATVKLRPIAAGAVKTIGAFFPDVASAARASAAVTAARIRPAVMELMDAPSLRAIDRLNGSALAARGTAFLLIQTDGPGAVAEAVAVASIVSSQGGDAESPGDEEAGERLLAIRRSFHWAIAALGEVLIEDVCVPRSRLADMFEAIEGIGLRHGLSIPTIAHAGDGNLHPNFVFERLATSDAAGDDAGVPLEIWAAAEEIFLTALRFGGTLSGEHGVGVLKRRWLEAEIGTESLDLQRRIKVAFDPAGIMNPGKVFPV